MSKKYQVIYADPPWRYNSRSLNRITKFGGGAMAHYQTMSKEELHEFKAIIDQFASQSCLLAMWVTGAMFDDGVDLLKAWGFKFATVGFVWLKLNKRALTPVTCPGFYTSSSCEFVLFGIRGKGLKPAFFPVPQHHAIARREHSRKPDEIREALEKMYPNFNKIELFARQPSEGWDVWGNETDKFESGQA